MDTKGDLWSYDRLGTGDGGDREEQRKRQGGGLIEEGSNINGHRHEEQGT